MMKQPDEPDIGDKWDLVTHRLMIAEEDLNSAQVLMDCTQYRGANNRAYYSIEGTLKQINTAKTLLTYAREYISQQKNSDR